jgi:hypothetical protein
MSKTPRVDISNPTMGYVTFLSYDPAYTFTARLGDGSPTVTGGYGGWDITSRPRRRGLTDFVGVDPMTIEILVLFDNWVNGLSVEFDILQLERMAGWGDTGGGDPPLIGFNSNGVIPHDHHDAPSHDWVIKDVQWGDADRNKYGNRVRQAATITVLQYVEDDTLSDQSSAARNRAKHKHPKHKPYIVTEHDVKKGGLRYIAQHRLGDAKRWHEIAKLNHIRDPKKVKKGQHLKLP